MKETRPSDSDTERMARVHAQYETLQQGSVLSGVDAVVDGRRRDTVETPCRLAPAIRRRVAVLDQA